MVDKEFDELYKNLKTVLPNILVKHGGTKPPLKPKARLHPMVKLQNYIEKHDLKLIDFFHKFDKDGSMSVNHEEFTEGIQVNSGVVGVVCSNKIRVHTTSH